ncbi:MAG: serine/threonine protein kinase, partial [Lachnospiraceae bacterium]|nr:serine/threonine protein kinase [Lachnospiraceae bacterium]
MLRGLGIDYDSPVLIGRGSFGAVYRVREKRTNRVLACKISTCLEMAEGEASLLGQIHHKLFPAYEAYYSWNGNSYLFMEYIAGSNLQRLLEQRGSLSQRVAVGITWEVAEGLKYLHEQCNPIIFRDIKPENIMICQDGSARLVDVGGAYIMSEKSVCNRVGSRGYAAPEQLAEGGSVGVESDVYALAKLLATMLHGRRVANGLGILIKQATEVENHKRIPDMRTFMQGLSIYYKGHWRKQILAEWKSVGSRNKEAEFYYQKN